MTGAAVFISYRRADAASTSRRIYDALAKRIGPSSVFMDVDKLPPGADFGGHIKSILPQCRATLVVIGPKWTKIRGGLFGPRRIFNPYDWVRVEVELALAASDMNVVPVLVNGARMPRAHELPASLQPLLNRHAAFIRRPKDLDRLLGSISVAIIPEMVPIPAGEFMMGAPDGARKVDRPQHLVRVGAFELGKYPVTFAEWDAANAAGAGLTQPPDMGWGRDRRPVINVSWEDAEAYIAWLNTVTSGGYRLPTEAEWEYACRAGTRTVYSTGTKITQKQAIFDAKATAPVGSCVANQFGLFDMHGNVWEWCKDVWNADYNGAPTDGSAWLTGDVSRRVARGGSWNSIAEGVRSADRVSTNASLRFSNYGFRVARTV